MNIIIFIFKSLQGILAGCGIMSLLILNGLFYQLRHMEDDDK